MCGIAGIVLHPEQRLPDLAARLQAMRERMVHRGPDDAGMYLAPDGSVGLATRRLAIRDLSPAGHMPMATADGMIVITYNGEIYNADSLRGELEAQGTRFCSSSDTEVVLQGYAAWGVGIVLRLRGMFAFAIHDRHSSAHAPNGKLVLARDPMGVKPLYYAWTGTALVFGSELKALLASGLVGHEVSAGGLLGYLRLGSVPDPLTIYRDILALEPATYAEIDLRRPEQITPRVYWRLPETHATAMRWDEAVARVRERLLDAVRVRMVSDVPLGAFLSGGLDSSAVVALMRQATDGPVRTCAMIFEEAEYSEAPYAQAMAKQIGAEHFPRVITAADMLAEYDAILRALDQPSVDGVNSYFVAQTARQAGLTVALSGLGGDELFAGYANTFAQGPQVYQALRMAQGVPGGAAVLRLAVGWLPNASAWNRVVDALDAPATPASAYLTRRGLFAPQEVRKLLSPDLWEAGRQELDVTQHVVARAGGNGHMTTAWVSRAELRTYTHHQLLRDTDVMSMAHSLEVREPLLDVPLIETVLGLPSGMVQSSAQQPKRLLAAAIGDLLPEVVRGRRDKRGFTFPLGVWLQGPLEARTRQILGEVEATGWLQPGAIDCVYTAYKQGQTHWSRVWALAALAACLPQMTAERAA